MKMRLMSLTRGINTLKLPVNLMIHFIRIKLLEALRAYARIDKENKGGNDHKGLHDLTGRH